MTAILTPHNILLRWAARLARQARFSFLILVLVLGIRLPSALAQQLNAQIEGAVTDATAAAVPDARVIATNIATNVVTTVPSSSDGSFEFLQLPVGTYNVTATKEGFGNFTVSGIILTVNQIYNLPVTLQVASVTQDVEVQSNLPQVETFSTQMGNVIEAQKIVNLPLNGRNWVQLQQLVPGVVATSDRFTGGNYATNGAQAQQNSFLVNGADSIDLPLNNPSLIPSPDSIAEFNLIDSTINPEFGRNSGGILNAVLKSGTNMFHGDAFEFYRDTFLNGRNIFQTTKPVFHQNQFGGTLGGPVRKNHTFFFLSYQGTRFREPEPGSSSQATVFTANQRNGVFPDIASSTATSPVPLVGENGATYPDGTPYEVLFPTGHIPTRDFNPISQKLLSYVPFPNSPGNLYSFNPIRAGNYNQGIARLDHTFGPNDALWVTLLFEHDPNTETLPFLGSTLPGFGDQNISKEYEYTVDWTHTLSPISLNELRVSYLRFNFASTEPLAPTLPSTLGFNISPQNVTGAGIPLIDVTGFFSLGFSSNGPQPRIDETDEIADNFSKVVGHHTLKVGLNWKRYNVNNSFYGDNNGVFTFGHAGPYSTGNAGADFLLGIPDSYQQGSGGWQVARTYEYYAYAQDSWRANQNLTLNYGAGYQIDTPIVNQHFQQLALNCFRPGRQSTVFPTAPPGLLFPGDQGCSASGYYNHYDHLGPRFGFAYSPGLSTTKQFVIRGGFGVYFNRSEEELMLQNLGAAPFSITSSGVGGIGGSPSFANPFQDIATGTTVPNPFPFTPAAKGSKVDFSQFYPMSLNVIDPNFTSPYAMNYNLNIQRQLPGAMLLQIGYVGSLGRHLIMAYEGNPISPAGQAACAASAACRANRASQHVDYPSHATFAPGNIFASVGTQASVGVSSYNSMQISLNKRFSHGLSFLAAYTFSHSIDDTSSFENSSANTRGTNPYNFAANKGDSSYDARQRFVISYDYELPHLSGFWNTDLARTIFDGWHLAGITTLQTGFPIPVGDTGFRSLSCDQYTFYSCPDAPNLVGPVTTYDPRTSFLVNSTRGGRTGLPYYYFNPNAFTLEPLGTIGNAGRDNFHGPGINNTDLSLSKRLYFGTQETRFLELRLEGFNLFNHTQFAAVAASNGGTGVNGNINSSNFGRVTSAAPGRTVQLGAKFYF